MQTCRLSARSILFRFVPSLAFLRTVYLKNNNNTRLVMGFIFSLHLLKQISDNSLANELASRFDPFFFSFMLHKRRLDDGSLWYHVNRSLI